MRISDKKKQKIFEQILSLLFTESPKFLFTAQIAEEIARDEEYVKKLLFELKKKGLVLDIRKNSLGLSYSRRIRWKLSDSTYKLYKQLQKKNIF